MCHQARDKEAGEKPRGTQKILLVIHMSLERERIQEILDTKNTLLLNIIFQVLQETSVG